MRRHLYLILFAVWYFIQPSGANAVVCADGYEPLFGGSCFFPKKPDTLVLDPAQKNQFLKIRHETKKKLIPTELYKVNLTCDQVHIKGLRDWQPFIQTTLATSHIVALTTTKLSSSDLPKDARASVTVFSVAGDRKNRQIFLNDNCSVDFAISGRDHLFIAATANQTSSNQPGPLAAGISSLISVALPIFPLFKGLALAANVLTDVSKSEGATKDLFSQLDQGMTVTVADDLFQDRNWIETPYSRVTVKISKIKSVVEDDDLRDPYETTVKDAKATMKLDTLPDATLEQGCNQFINLMRDRNLSTKDISYGLVMLTRLYGFDKPKTLTCMTSAFALPALDHHDLWDRYGGEIYNQGDAEARFPKPTLAPAQPDRFESVRVDLEFAVEALGTYVQTAGKEDGGLDKHITDNVHVINLASDFATRTEGADWTRKQFIDAFVAKGFTNVGCLTSDTVGIGLFLAFKPPKGDAKKGDAGKGAKDAEDTYRTFTQDDAVAFHVWVDGQKRITRVQAEKDSGLVEQALTNRKSRSCGDGSLKVAPVKTSFVPLDFLQSEHRGSIS
jgi:hypothetical protein